jgi:hypothetical protein
VTRKPRWKAAILILQRGLVARTQMRREYLHLSVYDCDQCGGPVVSGLVAVRENEISKETDIREVGAICLSCAHRQSKAAQPGAAGNFPPIEWRLRNRNGIDATHLKTAFTEMRGHASRD